MREINSTELEGVSGGMLVALFEAIAIGLLIFSAPKTISDSNKYLNDMGKGIGERTWEHFHPYDPNK